MGSDDEDDEDMDSDKSIEEESGVPEAANKQDPHVPNDENHVSCDQGAHVSGDQGAHVSSDQGADIANKKEHEHHLGGDEVVHGHEHGHGHHGHGHGHGHGHHGHHVHDSQVHQVSGDKGPEKHVSSDEGHHVGSEQDQQICKSLQSGLDSSAFDTCRPRHLKEEQKKDI